MIDRQRRGEGGQFGLPVKVEEEDEELRNGIEKWN